MPRRRRALTDENRTETVVARPTTNEAQSRDVNPDSNTATHHDTNDAEDENAFFNAVRVMVLTTVVEHNTVVDLS